MLLARVFTVCLIIYHRAPKEYCIIPSEDTQCCNWSCFMLENLTDAEQINITCQNDGGILLANINHAEISNIDFLGCAYITAMNIITFVVKNCAFVNYFKSDVSSFLELKNTNAIIKMCSFQEASTREIAMLTFNNSDVTTEQTDFTSNRGSIISCTARGKHIVTTTNCTFSNNSVMAITYNTPSAS